MATENKMSATGKMLLRAMSAERSLADEEVRDELEGFISSLPDDNPLKAEAERVKSVVGANLSILPKGHPIRLMAARFKTQQKESDKSQSVEKIKRRSDSSDSNGNDYREAVRKVNFAILESLRAVRGLVSTLEDNEVALSKSSNRATLSRLRRMAYAMQKGLADARMR